MDHLPSRVANILISGVSESSGTRKNSHIILDRMLKSLVAGTFVVAITSGSAQADPTKYRVKCEAIDSSVYIKDVKEINPLTRPKTGSFATMDRDGTKVYDEDGNFDASFSPTVKCSAVKR